MVLRLRGGGGPWFADVSNESLLVKRKFSEHAPDWRRCHKGLNIEGKCATTTCKAFGKMVISPQGFREFNLMKSSYAKCPQCYSKIKPETCGFYDCVWKYDGVHEGDNEFISSPWKPAFGNQYHRFDADEKRGSVAWASLLIVVKPCGEAKSVGLVDDAREEEAEEEDDDEEDQSDEGGVWKDEACSICWSKFGFVNDTASITMNGCGHEFHTTCISQWSAWCKKSNSKPTCPLCRASI